MATKMNFETALERLEEINKLLESGQLSLDDSLKLFEEGSKLSKVCYEKLNNAQKKIDSLKEGNEE